MLTINNIIVFKRILVNLIAWKKIIFILYEYIEIHDRADLLFAFSLHAKRHAVTKSEKNLITPP